jgi:lambda family phage portal protein
VARELAPPPSLTRLDRLIAWASPARGFRRARARVALEAVRDYEGAAKTRRTDGWRVPAGTSANAELVGALATLRDRSRDHVRNNPYGRRAVRALASSLVGYGMAGTILDANGRPVDLLQAMWDTWADTPTCDQRGRQTFGGLQRLVARTLCESGEVLVRRVWDADVPAGFRLQVLEADYLDATATLYPRTLANGHRIVAGIELDRADRPVAYWLLPHHPGDPWTAARGVLAPPDRVPADDVAHVFDEERAGQGRGCPMLASVTVPLRDLDECKDAHQVRQKIAACFAAFYTTPEGATRSRQDPMCDHVEPGMVEELPPGYEVSFASPPGVEGYADVMRLGLQAVAAGTGVPYEELSGDYSQFNFSSGRMSRGSYYALVEELQWQVLIPAFHDRVFAWFLEAAAIGGANTAGVMMQWTPPRRPLVDPGREIAPAIAAVRATLTSPQEAIRELGYDPETVLREWHTFTAWLDELELVSDLDPRRTTSHGARTTPPDADQFDAADTAAAGRGAPRRPHGAAYTNGGAPGDA